MNLIRSDINTELLKRNVTGCLCCNPAGIEAINSITGFSKLTDDDYRNLRGFNMILNPNSNAINDRNDTFIIVNLIDFMQLSIDKAGAMIEYYLQRYDTIYFVGSNLIDKTKYYGIVHLDIIRMNKNCIFVPGPIELRIVELHELSKKVAAKEITGDQYVKFYDLSASLDTYKGLQVFNRHTITMPNGIAFLTPINWLKELPKFTIHRRNGIAYVITSGPVNLDDLYQLGEEGGDKIALDKTIVITTEDIDAEKVIIKGTKYGDDIELPRVIPLKGVLASDSPEIMGDLSYASDRYKNYILGQALEENGYNEVITGEYPSIYNSSVYESIHLQYKEKYNIECQPEKLRTIYINSFLLDFMLEKAIYGLEADNLEQARANTIIMCEICMDFDDDNLFKLGGVSNVGKHLTPTSVTEVLIAHGCTTFEEYINLKFPLDSYKPLIKGYRPVKQD